MFHKFLVYLHKYLNTKRNNNMENYLGIWAKRNKGGESFDTIDIVHINGQKAFYGAKTVSSGITTYSKQISINDLLNNYVRPATISKDPFEREELLGYTNNNSNLPTNKSAKEENSVFSVNSTNVIIENSTESDNKLPITYPNYTVKENIKISISEEAIFNTLQILKQRNETSTLEIKLHLDLDFNISKLISYLEIMQFDNKSVVSVLLPYLESAIRDSDILSALKNDGD